MSQGGKRMFGGKRLPTPEPEQQQFGGKRLPSQYGGKSVPSQFGGKRLPQFGGKSVPSQFGGKRLPQFGGKRLPSQFGGKRIPVDRSDDDDDDEISEEDDDEFVNDEQPKEDVVMKEEPKEEELKVDDDDDDDDDADDKFVEPTVQTFDDDDDDEEEVAVKEEPKKMTAIEEEMARAEAYEREKEEAELRKVEERQNERVKTRSAADRMSASERKAAERKAKARADLVAKRQKIAEEEESDEESDEESSESEESEEEEPVMKKRSRKAKAPVPKKKARGKSVTKRQMDSDSDDSSDDSDEYEDEKKPVMKKKKKPVVKKKEESSSEDGDEEDEITLELMNKCRLVRDLLGEWVAEPYFDEAVKGMFVRLGIGQAAGHLPVYKVCEIIDVVDATESRGYEMGAFFTKKRLMLKNGKHERVWKMATISNSRITQNELDAWKAQMRGDRQKLPRKKELEKRRLRMMETAKKSRQSGYTETQVQEKIDAREEKLRQARYRDGRADLSHVNVGSKRTQLEHTFCANRDKYASALASLAKKDILPGKSSSEILLAPKFAVLQKLLKRVDLTDAFLRKEETFETLLRKLHEEVLRLRADKDDDSDSEDDKTKEPVELQKLRRAHASSRAAWVDFEKNMYESKMSKIRNATTKGNTLATLNRKKAVANFNNETEINEKKKHQTQGEQHQIFMRRPTKPKNLWAGDDDEPEVPTPKTTEKVVEEKQEPDEDKERREEQERDDRLMNLIFGGGPKEAPPPPPEPEPPRQRRGMSLAEYLAKARQNAGKA